MVSCIIRIIAIRSLKVEIRNVYLWYLLPLLALPVIYFDIFVLSANMPVFLLFLLILTPAGQVVAFWRSTVLNRKLRVGYYRFCPGCGHSLDVGVDSGDCPGCGQPFEMVDVRRAWGNSFADGSPRLELGLSAGTSGEGTGSGYAALSQGERSKEHAVHGRFTETLRVARWLLIPYVLGIVAMSVTVFNIKPTSNDMFLILMTAIGISLVLGMALTYFSARKLARKLRAGDGKFCIHCGYNLNDLGETGNCPECGDPFEIAEVQNSWSRLMSVR